MRIQKYGCWLWVIVGDDGFDVRNEKGKVIFFNSKKKAEAWLEAHE